MNKLKTLIAISIFTVIFIACNQASNKIANGGHNEPTVINSASNVVLKDAKINAAFKNYLSLKNALVASNVEDARKAAAELNKSLSQIEGCTNTASIAKNISASSDIAEQRKDFTPLSSDFIALLKHADVEKGTMYVQYCPMANSGKGSYWMASGKDIKNPYYGDEMLNCGEVKETITRK